MNQGYALPFLGWLAASYNTVTSNLSNPSNSAAIKMTGTINSNLLVETSINYDGNVIDIVDSPLANKPAGWSVAPFFNNGSKLIPGVWRRLGHSVLAYRKTRAPHRGTTPLRTTSPRSTSPTPAAPIHEVWLQLQPVHQKPAALRRHEGSFGFGTRPTTA